MTTVRELLQAQIDKLDMRITRLDAIVNDLGKLLGGMARAQMENAELEADVPMPIKPNNTNHQQDLPLKAIRGHRNFSRGMKIEAVKLAEALNYKSYESGSGERQVVARAVMESLQTKHGDEAPTKVQTVYGWLYNPSKCGVPS